ncbi:hypothetical protein ABH931_005825 [Streptacidiphilus sp. MAP12-33]|uniref:hypothetical protein n=1 Tax=Streptacidiphilus sp. MAP12-33 TaxID=3156266 RepID=UPI0035159908
MDRLWDLGTAHWALLDFANDRVGQVKHQAGLDLMVVRRPVRSHQYLVAALVPVGHGLAHQVQDCAVPFGIAVTDDPARAAASVTRRLLPSYQQALRTVGHSAGWSTLTGIPANRAVAATGRSSRDVTVVASPPTTVSAPSGASARRVRT